MVVLRATNQHYTRTTPGQASPDSVGYQVLAGLDYDDNAMWRYRLLLGGETRRYASATFNTNNAFIAEGEVTWTPTGLTTVRGSLVRGIQDAAQEGVSGYTYTAGRLTIDHEYMRDILLRASVEIRQATFLQGGGRQWGYNVGAGIVWMVNRSVRISATQDFSAIQGTQVTAGPINGDYTRSLSMLTLRLGL